MIDSGTIEKTDESDVATARDLLIARARKLGVEFSNNIGTDKLRERINAKLDGEPEPAGDEPEINPFGADVLAEKPAPQTRQELIDLMQKEQMRLVRVRITNMDPKKKDLPGEVLTVANEFLGTVRKFIPFGEVTDNGYHIPFVLYTMLDERKFLNIRVTKNQRTGREQVTSQWAKEFALEIMPPLTQLELNNLAVAQAAAGSIDNESL